jgi:hypothetical protein
VDERIKIRPDVKGWWAERLIDGTYLQLQESLSQGWKIEPDGKGHAEEACCLGVLCGVAIEHGVQNVRWDPDETGNVQYFDEDRYEHSRDLGDDPDNYWITHTDGDLPSVVSKWAFGSNFYSNNPVLAQNDEPEPVKAIDLNDNAGWSFKKIAEAVKELPELEVASNG